MEKIVVGMSGGVDSSVAAYLLKEEGYEVIGVTMQTWREKVQSTEGADGTGDAKRVAAQLGISYYSLDFRAGFQRSVVDYFVREYEAGRTPNPCIACNRYVKWEALLTYARSIGADLIATGHYADIVQLSNGRYALKKSASDEKDQTYALYALTQEQLAHTRMPLARYDKAEIRRIAEKSGLMVADKPDSMEICFVPDNDYAGMIERYTGKKAVPGNFVNTAGEVIGCHQGLVHYTVGQRKGLGAAFGKRMFVRELRPETNEVVLASNEELFSDVLYARCLNFMSMEEPKEPKRVTAKIRYNHKGAPAEISMCGEDLLCCRFDEPQRAITPGQALVFYDGDVVAGGGIIQR